MSVRTGKDNSERFQFNPKIVDLLRILKCQLCHLSSRKGSALHETLMLQFNQSFTDQTLTHAKLLRKLSLDDLFAASDRTGCDRLTQRSQNLSLFRYWFNLLKCWRHGLLLNP